jgi:hypothetical protein
MNAIIMDTITPYCLLVDETNPFPIEISKEKTIGVLKEMIRRKRIFKLDKFEANNFEVWRVDLPEDEHLRENANQVTLGTPLKSTRKLISLFPNEPAEGNVHFIVRSNSVGEQSASLFALLSTHLFHPTFLSPRALTSSILLHFIFVLMLSINRHAIKPKHKTVCQTIKRVDRR